MQQPRNRLGKGLGSLITESEDAVFKRADDSAASVMELDITKVVPNPEQPRKEFDAAALDELCASIKEKGVIQPILVSERPDGTYMIIAGERRYRASKLAGRTSIPALVKSYSDEETMEVALIENLQREDLNPLEEAIAFKNLVERFNLSQEAIAQKIGKNRATVANSLRLLKLPAAIQQGIANNAISAGHARSLLSIKVEGAAQEALFQAIIDQGLSVRDAEWIAGAINGGKDFNQALDERLGKAVATSDQGLSPANAAAGQAEGSAAGNIDIMALSRGATVTKHSPSSNDGPRRAAELWEIEDKLIVALGTKVQIKGDTNAGKIEITYFSRDDLERLHELLIAPPKS